MLKEERTMPNKSKPSTQLPANAGRRRVCFEVAADPDSQVTVAGTFNSWDPETHVLRPSEEKGRFKRFVYLPPGQYEYKFVIDGAWSADPNCPSFAPNQYGTLNSVLEVEPKPEKS